ncbi:MAG: YchJ family protein [Aquabacterium sp.]
MPADPCPCDPDARRPYAGCCGPLHAGATATDAAALMRSRYSAYVRGLGRYLLDTWAVETRPAAIEPDPPGLRWLGLQVRLHRVIDGDHAEVEFVARSKLGGRAHRLHETSRFERRSGRWVYVDGTQHTPPAVAPAPRS